MPAPFSIDWFTHDAAGFFTIVLSVVAIVQAGLFVWQLVLIRKSLAAAEEAARAATANAQAMIDNERPWIGVDTVWSKPLGPGVVIQEAFVRIKNTGKTPALRMQAAFKGSVLPKDISPAAPDVALGSTEATGSKHAGLALPVQRLRVISR